MIYLISYDIPNDQLRTQIAKLCEYYGFERIQFSVFMGETTRNMVETFALEANELIEKRLAKVTIIPICQKCYEKIIDMGRRKIPQYKEKEQEKKKHKTIGRKKKTKEKVIII
ncbi:MAG: CRISPR-associated endonuclease Cas2 [Candidatus Gerdarchaeota archaeon]|nr:MAG: CRISPR-associated endonuclease Cas2 [Candidatus Gerdarchaeota archaeon]